MKYELYLAYENGATSHRLKSTSRHTIAKHLESVLNTGEVLENSQMIMLCDGQEILNVSGSVGAEAIRKAIAWPALGSPRKLANPVTANVYMPEEVRQWLKKAGNGKVSQGVKELCILAGLTELVAAWDTSEADTPPD